LIKNHFHEGSVSEVSAQTTGSDTYVNILLAEPVKPEIKLEGDASCSFISTTTTTKRDRRNKDRENY